MMKDAFERLHGTGEFCCSFGDSALEFGGMNAKLGLRVEQLFLDSLAAGHLVMGLFERGLGTAATAV
jgi:hypothetical protein